MKQIVILISGRGSNMRAIIEASHREAWPANIAAVISNRADASGLAFAQQHGIATAVVEHKAYARREDFDAALQVCIDSYRADLVILAGFMRVLTPGFVDHYAGRLVNIHPSLLPAFPGLHTHRQALAARVAEHGATVHWVTADLDHGPVLAQAKVSVLPGDDEDTLAARVLVREHEIYPQVIRQLIANS